MEDWRENSLSVILEYPFDFERYIEGRLREIDDLDERRFAKEVLLEGLGKVIRCTEEKYRKLERRVYEEIEIEDSQYEAVMTIIKRENYDPTNGTLFPVVEEDLEEKRLTKMLSSEQRLYLGTVFLQSDATTTRAFRDTEIFHGTVVSESGERDAELMIQPAGRYRSRMESLYQIFQDNRVPWETVNTSYLDQFFDVFLLPGSEQAESINRHETVSLKDIKIRFGIFSDDILYDRIPLWNMEWISFASADFMLPCMNGIYYEHEFSLEDTENRDGYLIQSNEDILEIRHEKEQIVIKSQKEIFEGWRALHLVQRETVRSLDYDMPILTNHKRDSFLRRYSERSHVNLTTKTDLFRRIMELDIREYIEVVGYEICDNKNDYPILESMNWFVKDELFPMESRKVLLLQFEAKRPGYFLNDSIVRFVISQMQLEIGEYRCVGEIV